MTILSTIALSQKKKKKKKKFATSDEISQHQIIPNKTDAHIHWKRDRHLQVAPNLHSRCPKVS